MLFLRRKRKSENLKDQVCFLGAFDCILGNLEEMYKKKLEDRDKNLDEFDVENKAAERRAEDGKFFQRYFLPYAHILLYRSWLKTDLEEDVMMNELFTLGTGSETFDLSPEVHGICDVCASEKLDGFQNKSSRDIWLINIKVFKEQKKNKFLIPTVDNSDSDSFASSEMNCNPFLSDDSDSMAVDENEHQELANPFETSMKESDEEDLYLDACDICGESFPSDDYVQLHQSIFHHRTLKTKFVEEPESLMTTFIQPPTKSPSHGVCDTVSTSSKSADKSMIVGVGVSPFDVASVSGDIEKKYHFRKRLKY